VPREMVSAMSGTTSSPAPVTVVLGPETFLAERAVADVRAAVRRVDVDAEFSEHLAGSLEGAGALAGLTAPSLFSSTRVVVIEGAADADPDVGTALVEYAASPDEAIYLVIAHGGGPKGRGWLDKLRRLQGVAVVPCDKPKPRDLPGFVLAEVRAVGGRATGEVAAALVDAVGSDLRALAGAVRQLVEDSGDATITVDLVQRYFAGRAEVTSFAVADAAVAGRTTEALQRLRWAMTAGVAPVLISSALATTVRRLTRVKGIAPGVKSGDAAAMIGVHPYALDRLRRDARNWSNRALADAVVAVARADTDVKGGSYDVGFALERAVMEVARARGD
jgi:DNA polymerase III subunit delta